MSDRNDVQAKLEDQLANAHEQLLLRDQRINELERESIGLRRETAALRVHLESVLSTRAWRAAETFRRLRHAALRRDV
jgi:hypothetical protein